MAKGEKTGGRTKGTPNKKTAEAISRAERILQLIESDYFEQDIQEITSAQRIFLYSSMLEYVSPKLSRQELRGSLNNKTVLEIVRRTNPTELGYAPSPSAESNGRGQEV